MRADLLFEVNWAVSNLMKVGRVIHQAAQCMRDSSSISPTCLLGRPPFWKWVNQPVGLNQVDQSIGQDPSSVAGRILADWQSPFEPDPEVQTERWSALQVRLGTTPYMLEASLFRQPTFWIPCFLWGVTVLSLSVC